MRLPNRKPGKYTFATFDPHITKKTYEQLQKKLARLKKEVLPKAIQEVQLYAQNGDFSENAEYQIAKSRLRGINKSIDEISHRITHAKIIEKKSASTMIEIGNTVTVELEKERFSVRILGSTETDPSKGIISHQSPLGAALLGRSCGESITLDINGQSKRYTIIAIE